MKIKEVKATPVRIAFTEPEIWSMGQRTAVSPIIVEVVTDDGQVGLGESVPVPNIDVAVSAIQGAARRLTGQDPRNINHLWQQLQFLEGWCQFPYVGNGALAGVEMACWDILGKSLGVPVHALLGGKIRNQVPIMGFVQHTTPEKIEKDARRMVEEGYTTLYTKVGRGMESDLAALRALRRGAPEHIPIRCDPNEAWTPGHSLRMAHLIKDLNIQYIEQPLRMRTIHELAVLRQRSPVPIAANQASWLNWDILDIIRERAADVIMTDPWQAGGIANFHRAAAICETACLPMVYHSQGPLTIATRSAMTVLCSSTACMYANQTYNHMTSDDVVTEPVQIVNGNIEVSDKPGLGVELDRDKLAKYSEAYRREGMGGPFGEAPSDAIFLPNQ